MQQIKLEKVFLKHCSKFKKRSMRKPLLMFSLIAFLQSCFSPLGKIIDSEKSESYFFNNSKTKVIFCSRGNWFELGGPEFEADIASFKVLSEEYAKDKNQVYYRGVKQTHVDAQSFSVAQSIPKDKSHVYSNNDAGYPYKLEIIVDADPQSFTYLYNSFKWGKDKQYYFMNSKKIQVDYNSFKIINLNLYYDKDSIYIEHFEGIYNKDSTYTPTYHGLKAIEKTSGEIEKINEYYAKSEYNLYYCDVSIGGGVGYKKNKLTKAISTIKVITPVTVVVNDSLIIFQGSPYPVIDVDVSSFRLLSQDSYYFIDKNHIYYLNTVIEKADKESFKEIRDANYGNGITPYAKDKNHVYFNDKVLEKANPKTFHYDQKKYRWTDGVNSYLENKISN